MSKSRCNIYAYRCPQRIVCAVAKFLSAIATGLMYDLHLGLFDFVVDVVQLVAELVVCSGLVDLL